MKKTLLNISYLVLFISLIYFSILAAFIIDPLWEHSKILSAIDPYWVLAALSLSVAAVLYCSYSPCSCGVKLPKKEEEID